jgi:hypothetical protein
LGFNDFGDMGGYFRQRAEWVRVEHAEPMRQIRDQSGLVVARERSWRDYRPGYESRLPVVEAIG